MATVPAGGASAFRNELLCSLPTGDLDRIRPYLKPVTLVLSQVLHEVDAALDNAYFIESGLISLTANTGDSGQVEVGMTGREGFVGLAALLNPTPYSIHRALVQVPGRANRIQTTILRELVVASPALRDRCLLFIQVMLVQNSQIAACNARHSLQERLARWLLMSRDRIDTDDLPMTQECLSYMLGVRRAGVSVVANALQAEGLIRQSRGRITLLDHAGLQAKACSCYHVVERSRTQIMGAPNQILPKKGYEPPKC
jgi:CRP-like cAMP-binding protein